ncbi:hypothetical protein [Williamsia sp. 1135]|nr:hypothetical protein [Williamsia sp. 1135]
MNIIIGPCLRIGVKRRPRAAVETCGLRRNVRLNAGIPGVQSSNFNADNR